MTLGKEHREFTLFLLLCKRVTHTSILRPVKRRVLFFSPLLLHPNNRLEKFVFFICPFSTQQPKIYF